MSKHTNICVSRQFLKEINESIKKVGLVQAAFVRIAVLRLVQEVETNTFEIRPPERTLIFVKPRWFLPNKDSAAKKKTAKALFEDRILRCIIKIQPCTRTFLIRKMSTKTIDGHKFSSIIHQLVVNGVLEETMEKGVFRNTRVLRVSDTYATLLDEHLLKS